MKNRGQTERSPVFRRAAKKTNGRARTKAASEQKLENVPSVPGFLLTAALDVRAHAFAPYSHFQVGAALEDTDGRIHTGCNVENATYGLTVCAERVAVFKAISEGVRKFRRIAISADTDTLTPPCGACRQILWEFCGDIEIILVNPRGKTETYQLKDLFPKPFDVSFL